VYLYDQSKLQILIENKYLSALIKFLKQQKNELLAAPVNLSKKKNQKKREGQNTQHHTEGLSMLRKTNHTRYYNPHVPVLTGMTAERGRSVGEKAMQRWNRGQTERMQSGGEMVAT
jgi:hypothetical protein